MERDIHIFFDGEEIYFPPSNAWENFTGENSARLFWVVAELWRRHGWNPKRLVSAETPDWIKFGPRIVEQFGWYPQPRWQIWPKLRTLKPGRDGLIWVSTIDVIPFDLRSKEIEARSDVPIVCNFQRDHFSLSFFAATPMWIECAIETLIAYGHGKMDLLENYVSDETILRHYCPGFCGHYTNQVFPIGENWREQAPETVHLSRSALSRAYNEIPVV